MSQTARKTKRLKRLSNPSSGLPSGLTPSPLPTNPGMMLCTLVAEPFDDENWIFEPKFDGLRISCFFDGTHVKLLSRNDKPQNFQFPEIVAALEASLDRPALLDGEIVCLDTHGQTSFRALQQRFHLTKQGDVTQRMQAHPAYLYLFDLLYWDRYDLRQLPLGTRKNLLQKSVQWNDRLRPTPATPRFGTKALRAMCDAGGEGIVGKRLDSRYVDGRSEAWVKIKCLGRQEFVIAGYTDPQRSRVGLGALLVGYYNSEKKLHYAGKVGTGYTAATLRDLRQRLTALEQTKNPFHVGEPLRGQGVHWVQPKLVAEIAFAEWTQNGLLRQPRFEGLRPDKPPAQVRRESPRPAAIVTRHAAKDHAPLQPHDPSPPARSSAMALEEYKKKRDFNRTAEPQARVTKAPKTTRRKKLPIFVIQEHHASHLHYDFRLEVDGVLKSWAVPKEPVMDPTVKRLAVQVEDHPLDYATFHGDIPEGQYGGGHVEIWDHGTYENAMDQKATPQSMPEALDRGHLEFTLHGAKLTGKFALIRTHFGGGKKNWLLIKMKDTAAPKTPPWRSPPVPPSAKSSSKKISPKTIAKASAKSPSKASAKSLASPPTVSLPAPPEAIERTHTDKLMFPQKQITKGDVLNFYDRIADFLLPHLRNRPITLERLPNGVGDDDAPHFWQKNTPAYYPQWIPRAHLPSDTGKPVDYVLINDKPTLLYLVNQGCLTFHPWLSRIDTLDRPDYLLFDLDPGDAPFTHAVTIAKALHATLQSLRIEAFVKTSGKSGLHVLVPWTRPGGYDEARAWALQIAATVVTINDDIATLERSKAGREGKLYLDVMQNARGHHAVPPYVLRAVPAATVSTPLRWTELTPRLTPAAFDLHTLFPRLKKLKIDLMAPLAETPARA